MLRRAKSFWLMGSDGKGDWYVQRSGIAVRPAGELTPGQERESIPARKLLITPEGRR